MSECEHEKGLGYEGECVPCLKAELADTVTECLAAKSNEDILRKQLAFRSHLTQKEVNVVCRENEAMKQQLAAMRRMVEHVAYYSLDNMPPDVRAAAQALLQEKGE